MKYEGYCKDLYPTLWIFVKIQTMMERNNDFKIPQ